MATALIQGERGGVRGWVGRGRTGRTTDVAKQAHGTSSIQTIFFQIVSRIAHGGSCTQAPPRRSHRPSPASSSPLVASDTSARYFPTCWDRQRGK